MAYIRVPDGAGGYFDVTRPERVQFEQNLNGAVQYTLCTWLYKIIDVMGEGFAHFAGSFVVRFLTIIEPEVLDFVGPMIDRMLAIPDLPPDIRHYFSKMREGDSQAGAALAGMLGQSVAGASITSVIDPLLVWLGQISWGAMPIREFDAPTTWALNWRGTYSDTAAKEMMQSMGFRWELSEGLEEVLRPRTAIPDWIQYLWRHPESEGAFREEMGKRGFLASDIDISIELTQLIPAPGDLITMAVREAWRDDVAAKYGLDQDYVGDFGEWMKKQGFSEEWSHRWWRAHWRLPGIGQAQEMLWRTDMTEDDFREFLRFSDIPATWRTWLSEIAYRTPARVDIRRMHQMGVIKDGDLVKSYSDYGYNAENAANMAEFTILYNTQDERTLSKAEILKGYRLGVLTAGEASAGLADMGYSTVTIAYYLALEDYKLAEEMADEEISVVGALYTAGEIDKTTAQGRLSGLGLTGQRMALLFERWDIRRGAKIDRPSKGELERFVKQDIIDGPLYQSEMDKRGVNPVYVQWYYASILLDQEETARAEEERAAKEAERIRLAEEKTAYQSAKAELDYRIAEERLHFQQLKTAVTLYARREDVDELMATIEELQRDIAAIELEIAGKHTRIRTAQAELRELGVPPDLTAIYELIDSLNLQITSRESVIATLRLTTAEGQASIRVARLPAAITELNDIIAQARAQVALEQDIISGIRVTIAEAQLEIQRLGIPEEVLTLYQVVDQAQVEIAGQRATIADLRVDLAEATIAASWEEPAAEVEAQRLIIDAIEIDVRQEQEDIAEIKLEIAEIKAQVERMLSSEEIAELETEVAVSRERVRELEIDRARLRLV